MISTCINFLLSTGRFCICRNSYRPCSSTSGPCLCYWQLLFCLFWFCVTMKTMEFHWWDPYGYKEYEKENKQYIKGLSRISVSKFSMLAPYKTACSSPDSISLSLMILSLRECLIIWPPWLVLSSPLSLLWLEDLGMAINTTKVNGSSFPQEAETKANPSNHSEHSLKSWRNSGRFEVKFCNLSGPGYSSLT